MLEQCIIQCPDEYWNSSLHENRFWHITYHVLFYGALYLSCEDEPILWSGCKTNHQFLSKTSYAPQYDPSKAYVYSKNELIEFINWIRERLTSCFIENSQELPSGFSWISFSKYELYYYNLRHLQHHTGQLSERIKSYTGKGITWIGKGTVKS